MKKTISEFSLSDMLARYVSDDNGTVGLELYPANLHIAEAEKKCGVDSLVQAHLRGESISSGFANGHTMRNSQTTMSLKYDRQTVERNGNTVKITTALKDERGYAARHILTFQADTHALKMKTVYRNESEHEATLEMLSSFSIGNITPYVEGEAVNSIDAYAIRSFWSAEGRLVSYPVEELGLEPSWAGYGVRNLKIGQIGSMPVRKYFPFAALEDKKNKVIWAAQIACASSWQMELYRQDDAISMSGGLADFDYGHWAKTLLPGEEMETPEAIVTVGCGSIDGVCQRLVTGQEKSPALARNLPVLFNEYCTTWGKPSHESVAKILNCLQSKGIRYFVIDAGWFRNENGDWNNIGDWNVNPELFPDMAATADLVRKAGMIPGIWFEFECCARPSKMFDCEDHLLKRNGYVVQSGCRRFLDMRDASVNRYLTEKVIGMLKKYGFQYLKIDYNDSIGVGCDGAESLGEGLRQNILATQAFIRKIREEIPGIVIEICSSGGHRMEPSMLSLCDMESFSDAHECREIPIIAANLHRVAQPGKLQIWAVLRKDDSLQRIVYSIVNTFLGVMCLSGDVFDLSAEQWETVDRGIAFYNAVSHIISNGISRFYGTGVGSYRFPEGWQGVVRYSEDGSEALAVVHTFGGGKPGQIEIPLEGDYEIAGAYGLKENARVSGKVLTVSHNSEFEASAVHLIKKRGRD